MSDEVKKNPDAEDVTAPEEQKPQGEAAAESTAPSGEARAEGGVGSPADVRVAGGAGEPPTGDAAREPQPGVSADADETARQKGGISAEAKPPAGPAATGEPSDPPAAERAAPTDAEKEAKAKAAAEARAARANARAAAKEGDAPEAPKEPSPKQPVLDRAAAILREAVGSDAVEQAFINEKNDHMPYLIVKNDSWYEAAKVLQQHPELKLNYLRNLSGVDMESHMEVVYHLISLESKQEYCIKVKTDRENPSVASVTPLWPTANWNEREAYDLFGIDFPGHPDLRRIMMSDDWVGHPLRKDYEPLDPEV
ncbi:NADH-quinone oxidoreductase subunit C [Paenibacillus sp. GD4]|uniref:NADH-quinone oxidoreductase subunit C n=1 Tax=Paenibacillus sp. GD4 TaxID=3068890 RepID=UPI00279644AD|nr:NADH-quinone oxidoreductase subunit C [Paenibacillus sp. GD4]MDQ1911236.1 NADH-quinone oxidoreductase subunit C [Paenibacillus sp. GD4]